MPHSLRAKIKCLRYKGIITDKDCDRLCKALDNENVGERKERRMSMTLVKADKTEIERAFKALESLDKIRAEISDFEEEVFQRPNTDYSDYAAVRHCLEIIDRYRNEVSE